jgi:hypothetical protein
MDTINTIIKNAQTLSQAEVNWSLDAGPIWLVMMMVGVAVIAIAAWVSEARQERRLARQELYRKAHAKANIRLNRLERQGFQEIV